MHARNDPFLPGNHLPGPEEVSESVCLHYTEGGGHVGYVSGPFPGHLEWLPRRVLRFFEADTPAIPPPSSAAGASLHPDFASALALANGTVKTRL